MNSPSARRVWLLQWVWWRVHNAGIPARTGYGHWDAHVNLRPASAIRRGQFAPFLARSGVVGEWTVSNPRVALVRRKLGRFGRSLRPVRRGGRLYLVCSPAVLRIAATLGRQECASPPPH